MINDALNKVVSCVDLTETETKEAFDEILSGLADEVLASSFFTSLSMKRETISEIASSILSSREATKRQNLNFDMSETIEHIEFCDISSYVDLYFALDVILSANGIGAINYSFDSPFYSNRRFETLLNLGINEKSDFISNFENNKFLYSKLSCEEPYLKYTSSIYRKLDFDNILHVTNKMLNPFGAKNQFLGVTSRELVNKFANISLKLNNLNTLVLTGDNNLPFASIEGESFVAEAWKNKIFTYVISPELVDIKPCSIDDIVVQNPKHNAEILLNVFNNKLKNGAYNLIVINAGLSLYIVKKAQSIMDGIELAKKTIDSGLAFEKIQQLRSLAC